MPSAQEVRISVTLCASGNHERFFLARAHAVEKLFARSSVALRTMIDTTANRKFTRITYRSTAAIN
jgi:hypothetical protein